LTVFSFPYLECLIFLLAPSPLDEPMCYIARIGRVISILRFEGILICICMLMPENCTVKICDLSILFKLLPGSNSISVGSIGFLALAYPNLPGIEGIAVLVVDIVF
jgi:hypothetical protein